MLPRSTMCRPEGSWVGRSCGLGQVRRELITFRCCFSTLSKEQSVLISVDYRRMLIQCHAGRVQRGWERRRQTTFTRLKSGSFLLPSSSVIHSALSTVGEGTVKCIAVTLGLQPTSSHLQHNPWQFPKSKYHNQNLFWSFNPLTKHLVFFLFCPLFHFLLLSIFFSFMFLHIKPYTLHTQISLHIPSHTYTHKGWELPEPSQFHITTIVCYYY